MIEFFKKLFKGEEEKLEGLQWSVEEAWQAVKSEEAKGEKELESVVYPKFSQIKFLLKEAKGLAVEIKGRNLEMEEGHKKLRKIVQSTKNNFAQHIIKLTEQFEPPAVQDPAAIKKYCLESNARLEKDIANLWKSIAIANTLLKKELKELSERLEELNNHFLELKKFAENKMEGREAGLELLKRIRASEGEVKGLKEKLEAAEKEVLELQQSEEKRLEGLQAIKEGEEFKAFQALGGEEKLLAEEKSAFSQEIVQLLSPVAKPLGRMAKMVAAKKLFLDRHEDEMLNLYLAKPLEAVKLDPKAETLKKILRELEKGLEEETIGLKEKEKEKKLEAVKGLLERNSFERFWKLNRIKVKETELAERRAESGVFKRLEEAERLLERVRGELQDKGLEKDELKARQKKLVEEKVKLVEQAEEKLGQLMGREVKLA